MTQPANQAQHTALIEQFDSFITALADTCAKVPSGISTRDGSDLQAILGRARVKRTRLQNDSLALYSTEQA